MTRRRGGLWGEVEDTLATPEPGGAQAAPSRLRSLPPGNEVWGCAAAGAGAEGGEGGPASRERHPGRGSHLGPERCSRQRRDRGGVCPVPRPTEAVHTSARGRSGGSQAVPHAPAPAQRRGGRASSPLRTVLHRTAAGGGGGDAPRGACAPLSPSPAGRARGVSGQLRRRGVPGDMTRSISACGGGHSEPGARRGCSARGKPPRSAPGLPRAPLPAQSPHSPRTSGPLPARPRLQPRRSQQPLPTDPGKFVNNSQPRW